MIYFYNSFGVTITYGHVGMKINDKITGEVHMAQADGHELALALTIVPVASKKVLTARVWTFIGNDAQTIFANWNN